MKKEKIILAAVILFSTFGLVHAREGELSGTVDLKYLSSYIWRGFDMYPGAHGEGATQFSLDLDLFGTGFGMNVLSSRANTSGFEESEELDLTLSYSGTLGEGEACATNIKVGWMYYNHPDAPRDAGVTGRNLMPGGDMQEVFASFSWPEVCSAGVVPSYTLIHMWPSESKTTTTLSDISGWAHVFGLGYDWIVSGLLQEIPEQAIHLSVETIYNDGMGRAGVDHDWSHAVFGISTDFEIVENLNVTPGLYRQDSWEDSVNTSDETWVSLSVNYTF